MSTGDVPSAPGSDLDEVTALAYRELRRLAAAYLRREQPGVTLQPTALVNEAYLKLARQAPARFANRAHFCAIAAHVMRQILVDRARRRRAARHGGDVVVVPIEADVAPAATPAVDVEAVDEALMRLAAVDPTLAKLVELRYFGGLTIEETADALELSPATVKRKWLVARAWLSRELEHPAP